MDPSYPFRRCRDFPCPHRSTDGRQHRWYSFFDTFGSTMNSLPLFCKSKSKKTVGLAAFHGRTIKAHEIIGSAFDPAAQISKSILTVKTLLSPLSNEQVKVVRCLGLNYSDHAVSSLSSKLIHEIVFISDGGLYFRLKPKCLPQRM